MRYGSNTDEGSLEGIIVPDQTLKDGIVKEECLEATYSCHALEFLFVLSK